MSALRPPSSILRPPSSVLSPPLPGDLVYPLAMIFPRTIVLAILMAAFLPQQPPAPPAQPAQTPQAPATPQEPVRVPLEIFKVPDGFEITLWAATPMVYNPTN